MMTPNGKSDAKRYVSGHRLPVSLPLSRASRSVTSLDMSSAFVAQLLTSSPANGGAGGNTREHQANRVYRGVEASDAKRMPMGYRKALSA